MILKKKVFITGSSSGIGFQLAKKYLNDGYEVIINSNNLSKLKQASKKLNECDYYLGDITKISKIKKIINSIKEKHKNIDILICNYGNSNFKKNDDDIEHAINHNFLSSVNTINESIKILRKQSKIICISSICGIENIAGAPVGYSIAKNSLNTYVKLVSTKFSKKDISINAVAPGNIMFEGSLWQKKIKIKPKSTKKYIKENVPSNKFGTIEDIYSICNTISNNKTNYITGSIFIVDGGQTKNF